MTNNIKLLLGFLLALLTITGCNDDENTDQAPVLPPVESMAIDFGDLLNTTKSVSTTNTLPFSDWQYAALSVGAWNTVIGATIVVPVAAFKTAFKYPPQKIDDNTWEWSYTVDGFTSQYTARLVGTLEASQILWEMYVTKTGIDPFDEFLWFEGTSQLDGNSGQWILYHSAEFPEKALQIDWEKTGEEVGSVQYSYVRVLNNDGQQNPLNGSSLTYGLQDQTFDAYVNIHVYNPQTSAFNDSQIEWSRDDYSGHVMSEQYFGDTDWHCWNSDGADTICE